MWIAFAGRPVVPSPVTENTFPLSGENVLLKMLPEYGSSPLLQVVTINSSKFGPPHVIAATISAGM